MVLSWGILGLLEVLAHILGVFWSLQEPGAPPAIQSAVVKEVSGVCVSELKMGV